MFSMAGFRLFNVVILVVIVNCVSTVLSNDSEEEILVTDGMLYENQREQFGDALGYGYLRDKRYYGNGIKRQPDEPASSGQKEKRSGGKFVQKRSASGSDIFGTLAGISGGSVIHADKTNISKAVDILSSVTLTNPVIVTRKQLTVNGVSQVLFYVDQSLTKLAFEIKTSCCKPQKLIVTDPAGSNLTTTSANVTLKVDTTTMTYVQISRSFVPGNWTLTMYDTHNQDYDVTIHASSVINFDLAFCDNLGNSVSGQPLPGRNSTYVKVTPLGNDMVSNWTYLQIKHLNGSLLQKIPLGALRGSRTSKAFLVQVVWPDMDVRVGVVGKDKDGNTFTRGQETLVQPVGIRLKLNNSDAEFIHSCFVPLFVPFTITNTGPSGSFVLQATTDNMNFLARTSPVVVKIDSLSTVQAHCDVTLTSSPSSDQTTQVIISVVDSASKSQYVTKTIIANGISCFAHVTHSSVTTTGASTSSGMQLNLILYLLTAMVTFITVTTNSFVL
ncbi:uncharacterized protein LOC123559534 isoform X2 [Mercenaria mercenaria]|uniref:uncharacterized protein LOC123559534 isoform X2 n=1 Tax=Mercenaria mercenaria TaxID=6596 RepID=UPI00234F3E34|nr:uncharacterized protein LOC123559534 isoform X2 [Mercenaria mercenaria]